MTYTKAQILLINSTADYRSTNYGKHPKEVFNIDETILNNPTYNSIIKSLYLLENNYDNSIDELDILISNAQTAYNTLVTQNSILQSTPIYTYSIPNKQTYINFISQINTLIEDCNKIIINILNNTVNYVSVYTSQLLITEVGTTLDALVNKEWLYNYFNNLPKIPKVRVINATLICNSAGEIEWQQ